jgi:peptidoglycan/LPS O-acetylase OafA/YrhL
MWRRNLAVFVAIVGAIAVLGWVLSAHPYLVRDPQWLRWTAIATLLVLFIGGGAAFFSFDGDFWTRTGLTCLAPAVALLLSETVFGSDLAFPGFSLALAAAAAVICFLGSILIGGPAFLWKRNRERRNLATSGADRPGAAGRLR